MKNIPSPNYNERPEGVAVDTLVLHYTGMKTAQGALERMCDPKAGVSAHYIVDEDGEITCLVEEEKRAWHAGESHWRGRDGVNDFSIGVEIVNPGHEFGYRAFPDVQMQAVIELCKDILKRNPAIEARSVVAHSDIAPQRKEDPGELFDWRLLAENGIGIWPEVPDNVLNRELLTHGTVGDAVLDMQFGLSRYGYKISHDGVFGDETTKVVEAFQRHFIPSRINGIWDTESYIILDNLLMTIDQVN